MDTPDDRPEPRQRRLDGRTIGICVCIALIAALATALVAAKVTGDDGAPGTAAGSSSRPIQLVPAVDTKKLLATPLVTVDGKTTSLGASMGKKPVLVNLWAQSCLPCLKEMPLLEQASKANPGLQVLGVDTQDQLAKAKVMAKRTGITYPWVQDQTGDFFFEAQAAALPTSFVIQPSGEIVASKTGAFTSAAELERWLRSSLS